MSAFSMKTISKQESDGTGKTLKKIISQALMITRDSTLGISAKMKYLVFLY